MQLNSAVLRETPFRDVHVRHHFQARDDSRLQQAQLRRHRYFVQNSVDPIADTQIVFERLDVNVRRTFNNGFANDLIDELDHGSFRVVRVEIGAGLRVLQHLKRAVRFQNLVKRFCAHPVECLHGTQQLRARHQHPLDWFL